VVVVVAVDVVHVHGGVREGQALHAVDVHGGLPPSPVAGARAPASAPRSCGGREARRRWDLGTEEAPGRGGFVAFG
jgi:hypothetical protein